jgi:cysteinyl-tRNA synthetase
VFEQAMDDDLNVSRALAGLFSLRSHVLEDRLGPAAAREALAFVQRANGVLGVIETEEGSLDAEIEGLIERREAARASKDWGEADRIRDELTARGIVLEDTPDGVVWRKKR